MFLVILGVEVCRIDVVIEESFKQMPNCFPAFGLGTSRLSAVRSAEYIELYDVLETMEM